MTTDDAGSAREADADSSSAPTEPAPPERISPATSHRRPSLTSGKGRSLTSRKDRSLTSGKVWSHTSRQGRSPRAAFRAWRRSRPFWGGLLLVLGGLELLALPLTGVFVHGAIKLVIYIGIGGVFGVLIGVLLIAAGIVAWVNPSHRVFYGIAGIVLGIISFPASNLGGFLLGMLLAIIGGALAFAWVPADPEGGEPSAGLRPISRNRDGSDGTAAEARDRAQETTAEPETTASGTEGGVAASDGSGLRVADSTGYRVLAVAAMPAVLVAGLLGTGGAARAVSAPQDGGNCILGILCQPSSSPSPSPIPTTPSPTPTPTSPNPTPTSPTPTSPSPTSSATSSAAPSSSASPSVSPSASPSGTASLSATPTPSAAASASPSANGKRTGSKKSKATRKKAAAPSGLTASAGASVLSAGSATMTDFKYQGIVSMPVSGGGSEQMLEFTADSATLSGGVTVAVTQSGLTTDTNSPTLGFSDGLTLYATQLCGNIYGLVPKCFTPSTSSAILLDLANLLTGVVPITMTDVTTDQPLATAGALQTGSLAIGF